MNDIPILFNLTVEDLRRIGARGGRAYTRHCRARQKARLRTASTQTPSVIQPPQETTAAAVALLDAQFPWLRGAERHGGGRQPVRNARAGGALGVLPR
jgi:hypothetical protein